MKRLSKQTRATLTVLGAIALVAAGAIFGGIEYALAALGLIGLGGLIGAGVMIAIRVSRYQGRSLFEEYINYEMPSYYRDDDEAEAAAEATAEANPIDRKEKRLIVSHLDELFGIEKTESGRQPVEVAAISRQDKKAIMAHVDELFQIDPEQGQEVFS